VTTDEQERLRQLAMESAAHIAAGEIYPAQLQAAIDSKRMKAVRGVCAGCAEQPHGRLAKRFKQTEIGAVYLTSTSPLWEASVELMPAKLLQVKDETGRRIDPFVAVNQVLLGYPIEQRRMYGGWSVPVAGPHCNKHGDLVADEAQLLAGVAAFKS
jgi:hypothetical protein